MSRIVPNQESVSKGKQPKVTLKTIASAYQSGRKLSMITCYDYSFARIIDQTEVDMVLVGDSLGNVMLGLSDTLQVRMDDMEFCLRGCRAGLTRPLLIADMPFMSYASESRVLKNVERFMRAGAEAVKLEGGLAVTPMVKKLVELGIPVMGHIGFTPQSIHMLGGYRVQGRSVEEAKALKEAALGLEDAGVFSIVLELVPADCATMITESLNVPSIGIGAGPRCDGQVLVLHDLLGFDDRHQFKHVKTYMNLGLAVKNAVSEYVADVKSGQFPTDEQAF